MSIAQSAVIDSLVKIIGGNISDTNKVKTLNLLSVEYLNTGQFDKTLNRASAASRLAKKIGFKKGLARSQGIIGGVYYRRGEVRMALAYFLYSLKIRFEINDHREIANSLNNIGLVYNSFGNYPEALHYYSTALDLRKAIGDTTNLHQSFTNIAIVYFNQGDFAASLRFHLTALRITEAENNRFNMANSYMGIGNVYYSLSDYSNAFKYHLLSVSIKEEINDLYGLADEYSNLSTYYYAIKKFPDAIKFANKAITIQKQLGDKPGVAGIYNNLTAISKEYKRYDDALLYSDSSIKISEELEDKISCCQAYANKGAILYLKNNLTDGKKFMHKGLALAREIGALDQIKSINLALHYLYTDTKEFEKSLFHYMNYINARDSIFNEVNMKKAIKDQMNFDFEKKEQQTKIIQAKKDAVADEEIKRQTMQRNFFIAGFGLMLLLAFFIYKNFREKKLANIEITKQKKEVEIKNHLIEEKQKEILDSINYAKRIQRAHLPTEKYIYKSLEKLKPKK